VKTLGRAQVAEKPYPRTRLEHYGGLDHVAFADIPLPALKPDEILV
jgi:hypothetical protein